jgi:hypothetical protein
VIADTWKIRNTTTTYEHYCVLLEVVTFTANVCPNFLTVGKANTSDLTQSGVWFLWGFGSYLNADTTLEWSGLLVVTSLERIHDRTQSWSGALLCGFFAWLTH